MILNYAHSFALKASEMLCNMLLDSLHVQTLTNTILLVLPGELNGQRSLVVYCPWGRKESDTTEQLSTS